MSVYFLNAIPAGSIEVLFNEEAEPFFKRAHVEKYLGLTGIHMSLKTVDKREMPTRNEFDPTCSKPSGWLGPKDQQNNTDIFLSVYAVMHLIVRGKTAKSKQLRSWVLRDVVPQGLNKLLKEKDTQLALMNNDLTESQDLVRHLEYNNTGLQGEIRAKDQEIERRREEISDLIANRYVPRRQEIDNVLCFIDKKANEKHQFYAIRCQQKTLEKHKRCLRNRYPNMEILGECDDANAMHRWCRFKKGSIHEFHRNHFNLDVEGRELFETAFDIVI